MPVCYRTFVLPRSPNSRWLLLLACLGDVVRHVASLARNVSSHSENSAWDAACGAECRGECFAGRCLFVASELDALEPPAFLPKPARAPPGGGVDAGKRPTMVAALAKTHHASQAVRKVDTGGAAGGGTARSTAPALHMKQKPPSWEDARRERKALSHGDGVNRSAQARAPGSAGAGAQGGIQKTLTSRATAAEPTASAMGTWVSKASLGHVAARLRANGAAAGSMALSRERQTLSPPSPATALGQSLQAPPAAAAAHSHRLGQEGYQRGIPSRGFAEKAVGGRVAPYVQPPPPGRSALATPPSLTSSSATVAAQTQQSPTLPSRAYPARGATPPSEHFAPAQNWQTLPPEPSVLSDVLLQWPRRPAPVPPPSHDILDLGRPLDFEGERQLRRRIRSRRATEAMLGAENAALRLELSHWRSAGAKVAEREANIVELIGQAAKVKQPAENAALVESASTKTSHHASVTGSASSFLQVKLVVCVLAVLVIVICMRRIVPKSDGVLGPTVHKYGAVIGGGKESTTPMFGVAEESPTSMRAHAPRPGGAVGVTPSTNWVFSPMMRGLGFSQYFVEISEIQVGHLRITGDVHIAMNYQGMEYRTMPIEASNNALLKFNGSFVVGIRKYSSANRCTLAVVDRDAEKERIASLELPPAEMLRIVHDRYGEYFSFGLTTFAACLSSTGEGQQQPYMAMRLRDVTNF
mmetsp:Transcript_3741/g.9695  ORF Transcript_3741/g.9695 Transcript_3741/m.9695 type:complete len:698 (+) Transcript_3741:57-2150(+)